MSDFLLESLYLIHCKHFVDVFSPIINIATSRNIYIFLFIIKYTSTNYTELKKNKDIYKTIHTKKLNLTALHSRQVTQNTDRESDINIF